MFQECEWERLSELLCPIYNFMRDAKKKPTPFVPTDFFKPSWHKETKVEIEESRTDEQIINQFPKNFKDVKNTGLKLNSK